MMHTRSAAYSMNLCPATSRIANIMIPLLLLAQLSAVHGAVIKPPAELQVIAPTDTKKENRSTVYVIVGLVTMAVVCVLLLCIYLYTERKKTDDPAEDDSDAEVAAFRAAAIAHVEEQLVKEHLDNFGGAGDLTMPPPTYHQAKKDFMLMRGSSIRWHRP